MSKQIVNIGVELNDGSGDQLRTAFDKVNDNFTELYDTGTFGTNLSFTTNTITSSLANGDISIVPTGLGNVTIADTTLIISNPSTPATSIGAFGDKAGMIKWDTDYIYVCTADYDGATSIWRRASIATW